MAFRPLPPDRARDHVARRQFRARRTSHEPLAGLVDQRRARAAHRFADGAASAAGARRERSGGPHQLHVGQRGAAARRERPPGRSCPEDRCSLRRGPPIPPVAITTRLAISNAGPAGRTARRPKPASSSTIRRRASKPSRMSIEGVARAAAMRARINSRPAPSPPACTTRARSCAASSPSAKPPSVAASKRTPSRASLTIAAGAARVTSSTIAASQKPSPAASVSAACRPGCRRAIAAARPPGADSVDSRRASPLDSTTTGRGASSAPSSGRRSPAPTTMTRPRSDRISALDSASIPRRRGARARRRPDRSSPRLRGSRAHDGSWRA